MWFIIFANSADRKGLWLRWTPLQCLAVMRDSVSVKNPMQCGKAKQKTKESTDRAVLVADVKGAVQQAESDSADAKEYDCKQDLPMTKGSSLSVISGLSALTQRQVREFGINLKEVKPHFPRTQRRHLSITTRQ